MQFPNATSAQNAFTGCSSLTTFDTTISILENGRAMFSGCTALSSFSSSLPSLVTGDEMFFRCSSLQLLPPSPMDNLLSAVSMFESCSSFQGSVAPQDETSASPLFRNSVNALSDGT